jgi:hypothetical protein
LLGVKRDIGVRRRLVRASTPQLAVSTRFGEAFNRWARRMFDARLRSAREISQISVFMIASCAKL